MMKDFRIIDFHTHTFGEQIAERAIEKLGHAANIVNYSAGTEKDLVQLNIDEQIDLSVVLPVATKVGQGDKINADSVMSNSKTKDNHLIYFGAVHPDDVNVKDRLMALKREGFKGIKLHPVYQGKFIDDLTYLRLIDIASTFDLITVIHAGYDIGYPEAEFSSVKYIIKMLDEVRPAKVVLAHMGGFNQWDIVESDLAGADVYFDTSFCLDELVVLDEKLPHMKDDMLSTTQFLRLVNKHGEDKILFGTDSPWADRRKSIQLLCETGLENKVLNKLFYENAKKLL